jgi:hypothetical protein
MLFLYQSKDQFHIALDTCEIKFYEIAVIRDFTSKYNV